MPVLRSHEALIKRVCGPFKSKISIRAEGNALGVSARPVGCDQVEHRQRLVGRTMQAPNHLWQFRV